MSTRNEIRAFLDSTSDQWNFETPVDEGDLSLLSSNLTKAPLPEELLELYTWTNGLYVGLDVYISPVEDLEEFDTQVDYHNAFPGAVFFGIDEGSGIFFIDTQGNLRHGSSAILWCDRSNVDPGSCVYCAPDLISFLQTISSGKDVRNNPDLVQVEVNKMLTVLEENQSKWVGQQPVSPIDLLQMQRDLKVPFPRILKALLKLNDSITFEASGVQFDPAEQFLPIGDPFPLALRIARQGSTEYGISLVNEDGFPDLSSVDNKIRFSEGWVIRLRPGRPVAEAEVEGFLSEMIPRWLAD